MLYSRDVFKSYTYDLGAKVQLKQGATVLRTTGYAWNNADQITSQTVNGVATNYGYDLAGQLTSEVRSGHNVAYTYDANGNRLSKTVTGVAESYTYDLGDKMLTAGAKSYTYDAAGRTVGINAPGGTTTLSYDYESRVTAISGPGINETHTYNGLDTRVGTVQGGVSRTFVRDGSYVTDPVLRDGQATYTPGVSERRGGVSTWSHSGLKNADAQTSSMGAIAATRVYDAFGAELSATGTWKGPFGYAGGFGYQEDSSGLKLLGHRYYDPTTGRFLSRDPIKDGRNWYAYCGNKPLTRIDPTGLWAEIEFIGWHPGTGEYHVGHGAVRITPDTSKPNENYQVNWLPKGAGIQGPIPNQDIGNGTDTWRHKFVLPDGSVLAYEDFNEEFSVGPYDPVMNNCFHVAKYAAEVATGGRLNFPWTPNPLTPAQMRSIEDGYFGDRPNPHPGYKDDPSPGLPYTDFTGPRRRGGAGIYE
jgi:RHS repeat-associated protein